MVISAPTPAQQPPTHTPPKDNMTATNTIDFEINSSNAASPLEQIRIIIEALEDKKGERIRALDLSQVSDSLEYFVLATAGSQPQLQALERNVSEKLREVGVRPVSIEGPSPRWVLMNYGAIIVHLMTAEARDFYDLEGLWSDARTVVVGQNTALS
jgi:ribosome-associated protein